MTARSVVAPDVAIVLVTKSLESTLAFSEAVISSETRTALQFIICDIGTTEVSGSHASRSHLSYIRCQPSAAYSIAVNASLDLINAPIVGFFDVGVRVAGAWVIQDLIYTLTDEKGIVGPQVLYTDGRLKAAGGIINYRQGPHGYGQFDSQVDHPRYMFSRRVDFCPDGYLVRRDILRDLAGFDERYRTFEMAHADLALRARALNHFCYYHPNARIISPPLESRDADWPQDYARFVIQHAAQLDDEYKTTGHIFSHIHDRAALGRLLYIDANTPTPDQNSGSIDAMNILRILTELGFRVTFAPEDFQHRGKYTSALQAIGVETLYSPYYTKLSDVLTERDAFDLVVVCRADVAHRQLDLVLSSLSKTRVIFNTVDLHFLREIRRAELSGDQEEIKKAKQTKKSEIASICKADATIVLNDNEAEIIRREAPGALVRVVPLVRDVPKTNPVASFAARSGIVFVGSYQHTPNVDAVIYFVEKIWPLIRRRLRGAVFRIVGSGMTREVQALAGEGIEIVGFVDDLDSVLAQARVAVAPLRYGAGLKGKILSALLAGLPTVATRIGVEGFGLHPGTDILVAEDPQEFADAVVRLYTDEHAWTLLSRNGLEFAQKNFSFERSREMFRQLLRDLGFGGMRDAMSSGQSG